MTAERNLNSILSRLDPQLFDEEFDARRREWQSPLEAAGWHAQAFAHLPNAEGALGTRLIPPPVLSVGQLAFRSEELAKCRVPSLRDWLTSYVSRNAYPALIGWGGASAICFEAREDSALEAALLLAQRTLISVLATVRADLVRTIAIDTLSFGRRAALLRAAVPNLKLVTAKEDVSGALSDIQQALRENLDSLGLRDTSLGDFNQRSPDAARPFTFVFVASTGDLEREQKELVRRMFRDDIALRGGVQFVLVEPPSAEDEALRTPNSPRVIVTSNAANADQPRLDVVDPAGLDTREGGPCAALEVQASLHVDELERVAERCREHLQAGRAPTVSLSLPDAVTRWKGDASLGITVPLGRRGTDLVEFTLGSGGLTYNALIGGAVGTGKTVLLHGIISQAVAKYPPDELQLSLLDYKEGTEFSVYRNLPQLFALSLGPSSDFGLELLKALQREMSRRASHFKDAGVQDLRAYRRAADLKMPRHLVIIDEFQVLLANRADARDVLEDLIRRGRSAGIHLILASQSLADMSLNTAVLGQLGARICLKLSTSECARFLAPGNEAPARFQHPGQAMFNEREGTLAANVEFRAANYEQAALRTHVEELAALAPQRSGLLEPPFVYDADAPLRISPAQLLTVAPAGVAVWGLSQELPPRAVTSSLGERNTIAIAGAGGKVELLLAALRASSTAGGLSLSERSLGDILANPDDVPLSGPLVVTVTEGGFAAEDAIKALCERLPFLLVVLARDARLLSLPALRDDVICVDQAAVQELAYRKLPGVAPQAFAARIRSDREPSLFRLFTT